MEGKCENPPANQVTFGCTFIVSGYANDKKIKYLKNRFALRQNKLHVQKQTNKKCNEPDICWQKDRTAPSSNWSNRYQKALGMFKNFFIFLFCGI